MAGRLFLFGVGYAGAEIARQAQAAGWQVAGTATSEAKARELARAGIAAEPIGAGAPRALGSATHVVCTAPPTEAGDPVLAACASCRPRWLGYLSTTGVYGDTAGAWVDETATPRPGQPRSQWRLAAERAWRELGARQGFAVDLFRLPAIYGPGRSALDQVKAGTARAVDKPGQVFSRIHVEDLARAVLAAMERPAMAPGTIYNVTDDEPAPQPVVIAYAARLLGLEPPPVVPWAEAEASMSAMARSFYAENRRVRNERMKQVLGVTLKYPTYREGLRAIRG
ncbi:MAG TPA: SDR family oxidoreductase [Reyranella sp.]|nr:SDR family oxidoreductase [Reyranella sp.]